MICANIVQQLLATSSLWHEMSHDIGEGLTQQLTQQLIRQCCDEGQG